MQVASTIPLQPGHGNLCTDRLIGQGGLLLQEYDGRLRAFAVHSRRLPDWKKPIPHTLGPDFEWFMHRAQALLCPLHAARAPTLLFKSFIYKLE